MQSGLAPPFQPQPQTTGVIAPPTECEGFIDQRLRQTRRQVKTIDVAGRAVTLAIGVLVYLFAAVLVDHWLIVGGLGSWGRLLLWLGLVMAAGTYFVRCLLPLLLHRINPIFAAATIEKSEPTLKNSLINFLLLRDRRKEVAAPVYHAIESRAAADLSKVNIDVAVDRAHLVRLGCVLVAAVALFSLYLILSPKNPLSSAARILFPWSSIEAPTRVTIRDVQPGDKSVFHGDAVEVSAIVAGLRNNEPLLLVYSTADGQIVDQTIEMTPAKGELRRQCRLPQGNLGLQQDYEYYVAGGDCRSRRFHIRVQTAPTIDIDAVTYHYPPHAGIADRTVERPGDLRAIEGTEVTLRATANTEIKPGSAEIDLGCTGRCGLRMTADGQSATGHFTLRLMPDDLSRPQYESCQLRMENVEGQPNPQPIRHRIEVIRDVLPDEKKSASDDSGKLAESKAAHDNHKESADKNESKNGEKSAAANKGAEQGEQPDSSTNKSDERTDPTADPGGAMQKILQDREKQQEKQNQEADGQKANEQKADGQKGDEQEADGQKADGQKAGGQEAGGQKTDGQKANGQSNDSQKADEQKADGQKANTQSNDGQKASGQKADGQKTDGQKADGQKENEQSNNNQKADGQKTDGQKAIAQSNDGQKADGQKADGQKAGGQGADGQKADGQDTNEQRDGSQKVGGQKAEGQKANAQSNDGQKTDGQKVDGQKGDGQKADGQKADGRSENAKSNDGQKADGQKTDGKKAEGQGADGQKPDGQENGDGQKADAQKADGQKTDGRKGDGQKAEGQKADGEKQQSPEAGTNAGNGAPPSPQELNRDRNKKPGEPSETTDKRENQESQSPSTSPHQSDSQGATSGDRSGSGEQGGGQRANEQGVGSSGSHKPADNGGSKSNEPGQGDVSQRPGDKVASKTPTGGAKAAISPTGGGKAGTGNRAGDADKNADANKANGQPKPSDENKSGTPPGHPADGATPGKGASEGPSAHGVGGATTGGGRAGSAGPSETVESPADEVNLDYARRQTELALEHLRDQLAKEKPELLDRLAWTKDDARRFLDRWETMKLKAAEKGPQGEAARKELDEALRSLGLRPHGTELRRGGVTSDKPESLRDPRSFAPPPDWDEQFRAYTRGVAGADRQEGK